MFALTDKRLIDLFVHGPETGMGYAVVTMYLRDGRVFPQVVIDSGRVTRVRHHTSIPFTEDDIDHFKVTNDKWDWRERP